MAHESSPTIEPRLYINNQFVTAKSGKTLPVSNPFDDSHIGDVQCAGPADIDDAVSAAEAALKGEWSTFTAPQRAKCLFKLADLMEAKGAELAKLDTLAMGTPISMLTYGLVPISVAALRYFAGWADKIPGESYKDDQNGFYTIVEHAPLGVCAAIAPWNATPLYISFNLGAALAGGNVLIYKASEGSPFAALGVAALIAEAGFPPGVVNFVSGGGETGALLASHMKIRGLSFTGSPATGHKVLAAAAQSNLKKVVLELGGKAPAVVFDDADFDNALECCADRFLRLTGQTCVATSRVLVQKSISEKFVQGIVAEFKKQGEGLGASTLDPTVMLGPLANKTSLNNVLRGIEKAKEGATLVVGGERKGDAGCFVTPAVFVNPSLDSSIWKEELFGPVVVVQTFETEDEAVLLANDTEYGLHASVFTGNVGRAMRVARKMDTGMVTINANHTPGSLSGAFGGAKGSGLGRQGGLYGIMEYLETKTININMTV